MQAHDSKCSHTLQSAFVIVFLGIFVIVFVFIEKDFLFDMFTFIAWDVGEHLYWMKFLQDKDKSTRMIEEEVL